ncbi:pimeloyl-[acyl-carrier protein] methyl ester esterase [Endobacter medicaginis]|uniref:Pimeloyl-[acyl-carrier protein] methyl ester esterase n=3 Tax=Endobacter medicaginis TaxID=1181271 RepID=A0A839USJ8_9PROT|nr:alpha/beta hydrolase [Endobacter medicaginis]MBB3172757.1 pimeloyl-[acyl-carrier protein] methyl ester esterase [Endobacter medicaginis]MCX5474364.1 alpha/beta hydrolase [Endobacter medicaginis]
MKVMLFHGWGFDASFWEGVVACLPAGSAIVACAERGYFGASVTEAWPEGPRAGTVAVGHSMGMLHLLADAPRDPPGAMLSINGFARFCAGPDFPAGVPGRLPTRMLARLETAPAEVLATFRAGQGEGAAGLAEPPPTIAGERLADDLCLLIDADMRAQWASFTGPKAALAGVDDALITRAHAFACFGDALRQIPGGHLLPLTAPRLCADAILALGAGL